MKNLCDTLCSYLEGVIIDTCLTFGAEYSATPTLGIKLSATQLLGVRGAIQDKAKKAEPGTEWRAKLKAHSDCVR